MSPEPLPETLPVRASPSDARRARRLNWCGKQRRIGGDDDDDRAGPRRFRRATLGDLLAHGHAGDLKLMAQRRSSLAPAPDRVCASRSAMREDVPIPPLNSKQIMPVPPPTLPSAHRAGSGPRSSASKTCCVLDVVAMGVVQEAIIGLGDDRQSHPRLLRAGARMIHLHRCCVAHGADTVRVGDAAPGLPGNPDSSIQVVPVISPLPLRENQPAKTGSADSRPRGQMAVTPVRTDHAAFSFRQSVAWPTSMPLTSVMAFNGPGVPSKGTPRSRARWASAGALSRNNRAAKEPREARIITIECCRFSGATLSSTRRGLRIGVLELIHRPRLGARIFSLFTLIVVVRKHRRFFPSEQRDQQH